MDLFTYNQENRANQNAPLADQLRPQSFSEFIGQQKIIGIDKPLIKNILEKQFVPNLIFWGPPGSGKTTLAHLISKVVEGDFINISAIDAGAKDLKEIGLRAHNAKLELGRKTILFVDEIHRFNKAQQDILLPFTEKGDFILIGATTEHPSYELRSALLSRCRVLVFEPHSLNDLKKILETAFQKLKLSIENYLENETQIEICKMARGDARQLLNITEQVVNKTQVEPLSIKQLQDVLAASPIYYDKDGDEHYDCISAFIKSLRGSDPDAGLYYLARMLEGGEDPVFIARRLVILASEDVGNADPNALPIAVAGLQAVELVGMPEAGINLAQVTTYIATAPKSNRSYLGYLKAQELVKQTGQEPVPIHLRSSRTTLSKGLGYGRDYQYSHNSEKGWNEQSYLPDKLKNQKFYEPTDRGFEKQINQFLNWLKKNN